MARCVVYSNACVLHQSARLHILQFLLFWQMEVASEGKLALLWKYRSNNTRGQIPKHWSLRSVQFSLLYQMLGSSQNYPNMAAIPLTTKILLYFYSSF